VRDPLDPVPARSPVHPENTYNREAGWAVRFTRLPRATKNVSFVLGFSVLVVPLTV
jgi:hypothetical protein